jgi:hypothetical protein
MDEIIQEMTRQIIHNLAHFIQGVKRSRFNSNQVFLLMQKLKSAPKGFTLGVKAEIEKNLFNLPQVILINAELYGLVNQPKAKKKDTNKFGKPIWKPLGPMFQHLLIS